MSGRVPGCPAPNRAGPVTVTMPAPDDFAFWRDAARRLVQAGVAPERVTWSEPGSGALSLFDQAGAALPDIPVPAPPVRASRAFPDLAKSALLHRDPARFALLYRLLWRLQRRPTLIDDGADPDVRRAMALARQVRRDIHKMRAFVRFRVVDEGEDGERYVAWFEPEHHILRANARFFVDRFASMRWSILTPAGALHWDGETLAEGPPARREDAPPDDAAEDLWKRYYASIFNPARLKVGAMLREMPRKYWHNMPEAALIPDLIAGAQAREAAMIRTGSTLFDDVPPPTSLAGVGQGIRACRRCPIGCNGTDAVAGEGLGGAALMIVGEQPGDVEEAQGRPFVGPAGRLLDTHLERAGIDRAAGYVTNAVKHFKFEPRGKRRIHQTPTAREIDICRWWLDAERRLVRPRHILALGASAARSVLGRTASIGRERGAPIAVDGATVWVTVHPSFLLRVPDNREVEEDRFQADLQTVAAAVRAG